VLVDVAQQQKQSHHDDISYEQCPIHERWLTRHLETRNRVQLPAFAGNGSRSMIFALEFYLYPARNLGFR
jgi:hypothetical protein